MAIKTGKPRRGASGAFTLLEVLTVVAIMVIVMVLAMPSVTSIQRTRSLTNAANEIAGMLEQARAYAMAQNTYVWVGFRTEGADTLIVAAIASRSGAGNPASDIVRIGKIARFENLQLVAPPSPEGRPDDADVAQLADAGDPALSFAVETPSGEVSFGPKVIQWNSRGEARVHSSQVNKLIEFGLRSSANGVIINPADYAAIRVGGLAGDVSVYRP